MSKKYYVIEIIGKITITRVRNDSAGAGESFKMPAKVILLSPESSKKWPFLAKVNWRKYFRQVMSRRPGEFAGESASRNSVLPEKSLYHPLHLCLTTVTMRKAAS